MTNDYVFQILMREREREILEEVRRCGFQSRRHRRGLEFSKGVEGRLLSVLKRLKTIAEPRLRLLQAANIMEKISATVLSLSRKGIDNNMDSSWD